MADIIGNISAIETITGTIGVQQIRGQISPGIDTGGGGGGSSDNDHRIVDAGLSPIVNTLIPKIVTVSGGIGALSGTADGYEPPYNNTVAVPINKPLGVGETASLSDSGVNIPTLPNGTNTLSVGTTVAPEEIYIRYRTTS